MLSNNIFQPSESLRLSPVVLVKNKDGSGRSSVDYRQLNKITKKDVYPLPHIDNTLDCLKGAKYFSSIDLFSGYWQIKVDEANGEKTAFVTPEGLYEFKVTPFGLCISPMTLERMRDNLLRYYKWTMRLSYLNNVVAFGETLEEHLSRLKTILQCMLSVGLILNPKKAFLQQNKLRS